MEVEKTLLCYSRKCDLPKINLTTVLGISIQSMSVFCMQQFPRFRTCLYLLVDRVYSKCFMLFSFEFNVDAFQNWYTLCSAESVP